MVVESCAAPPSLRLFLISQGKALNARCWIFGLLCQTRVRKLDFEEHAILFIVISVLYKNDPNENLITAENMTNDEIAIGCDYLTNVSFHTKKFTACNPEDAQSVLEGMVIFRIEILPQLLSFSVLDSERLALLFEDHIMKEMSLINDFLPDNADTDAMRSQYFSTLSEYELTD